MKRTQIIFMIHEEKCYELSRDFVIKIFAARTSVLVSKQRNKR